jgi:hypothetical protein
MYWIRKRKPKRASSTTKHYLLHKEASRTVIHQQLQYWNQFYDFQYNRVAIRNQRRCWGSCSSLKNLNFNYKLLFLPNHLLDYIVIHELCHLKELNHSQNFWALVELQCPDYKDHIKELRAIERGGLSCVRLEKLKETTQTDVVTDNTI